MLLGTVAAADEEKLNSVLDTSLELAELVDVAVVDWYGEDGGVCAVIVAVAGKGKEPDVSLPVEETRVLDAEISLPGALLDAEALSAVVPVSVDETVPAVSEGPEGVEDVEGTAAALEADVVLPEAPRVGYGEAGEAFGVGRTRPLVVLLAAFGEAVEAAELLALAEGTGMGVKLVCNGWMQPQATSIWSGWVQEAGMYVGMLLVLPFAYVEQNAIAEVLDARRGLTQESKTVNVCSIAKINCPKTDPLSSQ